MPDPIEAVKTVYNAIFSDTSPVKGMMGDASRFFKMPRQTDWRDVATTAAVGGAVTGGSAATLAALLTKNKKKRLRNALIAGGTGAVAGGAAGAGYSLFTQRLLQELAGKQVGPYKPVEPEIDTDPNGQGRQYTIFIPGMGNKPVEWDAQDLQKYKQTVANKNTLVARYGNLDPAYAFIKKLRPQDKLNIVGFSTGAPAALELARTAGRPVDTLETNEPVNPNPLSWLRDKVVGDPFMNRPQNVRNWVNYTVRSEEDTDSNWYARMGGGVRHRTAADVEQINFQDNHGIWKAKDTTATVLTPQQKQKAYQTAGMLAGGVTPITKQDESLLGLLRRVIGMPQVNKPKQVAFNQATEPGQTGQSHVRFGRMWNEDQRQRKSVYNTKG